MRRKRIKNMATKQRRILNAEMAVNIQEYQDEVTQLLCGCNCCVCNPYYGDFWESFVQQDELTYGQQRSSQTVAMS
jgi:hypothetical protein